AGGRGGGAGRRRARGDGGPRPRPAAVPPGDGPAVSAARSGRPRVVVTRRLPAPVEEQLTREFDVRLNPDDRALSAAELADALRDADGLLPTVTDRLTREVLAVEPLRARIIANYGVGFNHIDTASAKARGLVVTNTPDVLTDDTADDAVMLMLMVARRGAAGARPVRAGARHTGDASPDRCAAARLDEARGVPDQQRPGRHRRRSGAGRGAEGGNDCRSGARRVRARARGDTRPPDDGERRAAPPSGQRHARDPDRHGPPGARQPQGVLCRRAAARPGGVSDEELARTAGL